MTTQHPYPQLAPVYDDWVSRMEILPQRAKELDRVCAKLVGFKPRYEAVRLATGVPVVWDASIFEREASSNFTRFFGNGDPLNKKTTHVPKGFGPYFGPDAWMRGTVDALTYDHIASTAAIWSWSWAAYKANEWNGFGPNNKGVRPSYLVGGTNLQQPGKYVADGVWNPSAWDMQLGVLPMWRRMIEMDPSLAFTAPPAPLPGPHPAPPVVPSIYAHDAIVWLQTSLNALGCKPPLMVDGSFGRQSRRAVVAFQTQAGIHVDGIPGADTVSAIQAALARKAKAPK